MKEARKHCAYYIKGEKGAAHFRHMCGSLSTLADLDILCEELLRLEI